VLLPGFLELVVVGLWEELVFVVDMGARDEQIVTAALHLDQN